METRKRLYFLRRNDIWRSNYNAIKYKIDLSKYLTLDYLSYTADVI